MDGWKEYEGKKVFLRVIPNRVYSGKVIAVEQTEDKTIFIKIIDREGYRITINSSQILFIQEEK